MPGYFSSAVKPLPIRRQRMAPINLRIESRSGKLLVEGGVTVEADVSA